MDAFGRSCTAVPPDAAESGFDSLSVHHHQAAQLDRKKQIGKSMALYICGDPELQDEYLAVPMRLRGNKMDNASSRIFMILRILRYPAQHAIMHQDMPAQIPAAAEGTICRMHLIRAATDDDVARYADYESSRVGSIVERMSTTTDADQRRILARHLGGIYEQHRALVTYKPYEVEEADEP